MSRYNHRERGFVITRFGMVAVGAAGLSGCFGEFRLTRTVYAFNQGVSDHVVAREALFVGFLIVPVYPVALLADGIVLNTLELATGDNPVDALEARTTTGRRVVVRRDADGGWSIAIDGERLRRLVTRGRVVELVEGDVVIARVEPLADGSVRVDADGASRIVAPEQVNALVGLRGAALVAAVRPAAR